MIMVGKRLYHLKKINVTKLFASKEFFKNTKVILEHKYCLKLMKFVCGASEGI